MEQVKAGWEYNHRKSWWPFARITGADERSVPVLRTDRLEVGGEAVKKGDLVVVGLSVYDPSIYIALVIADNGGGASFTVIPLIGEQKGQTVHVSTYQVLTFLPGVPGVLLV